MSRRPPRRESSRSPPDDREHNRWGALTGDRRGQSTTLDYTLSLAVAALVVTGLFAAAGDFVSDQREQVVRTELGVVGQQLAGEIVAADRLVRAGEGAGEIETLTLNASLPQRVAGASYTVEVVDTGTGQWLNLSTADPGAAVAVRIETQTAVATGAVDGGTVGIVYDPSADELEVRT